jgi:tetratricopeptide (TPR) repeat protein
LGRMSDAVVDCTAAIAICPTVAPAYSNRACGHIGMGEYDKAIKDCSEAIRLDAGLAEAYWYRGVAYNAKDQQAEANADFAEAARLGYCKSCQDNRGVGRSKGEGIKGSWRRKRDTHNRR